MTQRGRTWSTPTRVALLAAAGTILLAACSTSSSSTTTGPSQATTQVTTGSTVASAACADVIGATIDATGDTYRISATVLSPDTGWDEYADAWEARAPDGSVLGTRVLAHPHVDEQPFTRSLSDVTVPEGVTTLSIAARDSVEGFCGATFDLVVPGR